jgi:tRNA nucleotidyltransferase (CCA-adding enzyme)
MSQLLDRLPESDRALLARVAGVADRVGGAVYLVGGAVRDLLLGRVHPDLDILVDGDGIALAEAVAAEVGATVVPYPRFHTATIFLYAGGTLDFASARTEAYPHPGALPVAVRGTLNEDLYRRDFTVNAMALALNGEAPGRLLDPFAGQRDLGARALRALHAGSFRDDPTRALRAARFEVRLGFHMDEGTEKLARETIAAGLLDRVSGERIRAELLRLVAHPTRQLGLRRLADLGIATALEATWQVTEPGTMERRYAAALRWANRSLVQTGGQTRVSALLEERYQWLLFTLRELESAAAGRLLQRLRVPNRVAALARRSAEVLALAPALDTPHVTMATLAHALGEAPEPLCLLLPAQLTCPAARARLRRFLLARRTRPLLLTGKDLLALGIPEGPVYRRLKAQVRAAQLAGEVRSRAGALALAKRLYEQQEHSE